MRKYADISDCVGSEVQQLGSHSKKRLNTQKLEDLFSNAFLLVSHCQERQLLYLVTIPCMLSSSLVNITDVIFCIPSGDPFNP